MDAKSETTSDVKPNSEGAPLPPLLLAFLAVSFLFNAYIAIHDTWALAYVVFSYVNLVLFFLCLEMFAKAPVGSKRKAAFSVGAWFLYSTFCLVLAYGPILFFGDMLPLPFKILLWIMAGTMISVSIFLWCLPHGDCNSEVAESLEP